VSPYLHFFLEDQAEWQTDRATLNAAPIVTPIAAVVLGVAAALGAQRAYDFGAAARAAEPWPNDDSIGFDFGAIVEERRARE
jgi:hypothetical protein